MNKKEAVAALRAAAEKLEASEYDGEKLYVDINAHDCSPELVQTLLAIADEGSATTHHEDSTHWVRCRFAGCRMTVFHSHEMQFSITDMRESSMDRSLRGDDLAVTE